MRWRARKSDQDGPPLRGLGTRVEEILRLAERQAEEHRAAARQEAAEIVAAATREAAEILAAARRSAGDVSGEQPGAR